MDQDRKKELWHLVKEIGEIINETSKTINCLVVRRVDVSKFKEYFNQLQNFFALVSRNINRPITNHQLNVIKAKLENSKEDNIKLLNTLKKYLAKSEKKQREKLLKKQKKKSKRSRRGDAGETRARRRSASKHSNPEKAARKKTKTPAKVKKHGRRLVPSTSSPYLDGQRSHSNLGSMKERYLRKIKQEESAIEGLEGEINDIKQEIFDIKVKNSDAIDWHSSKCRPIVRAANRKMTMMYLGSKTENIKLIDQISEWTKLETFLKKKVGMAFLFFPTIPIYKSISLILTYFQSKYYYKQKLPQK